MPPKTRRQFFKQTGLGLAGVAILQSRALGRSRSAKNFTPPHQGWVVPAIHGYAAQSIFAGEKIQFRISSTVSHQLSIFRLGQNADDTSADEFLHRFPVSAPTPQAIHPGSYVFVQKNFSKTFTGLTLECWVRPAKIKSRAGLITQCDAQNQMDFGLLIEPGGVVSFLIDEAASKNSPPPSNPKLKANRWQHLVATWDGKRKKIWLDGKQATSSAASKKFPAGKGILRLAAGSADGITADFFDGDLAMPVIYNRPLHADEIAERFQQRGLIAPTKKEVLACWNFSEETGNRVADISSNGHHGQIVNHATWMIGGPSFDHEVLRFADYEPKKDERRGHGLRFASDDLYDCGWSATHDYKVPSDAKSGMYVGRIEYEWEGKPHLYHITFIVKKPARRTKAPILVLTSTNTWRAYNGAPFPKPDPTLLRNCSTQGLTNSPSEPPAYCFYRRHAAGQGTYQIGLNMPFMGADPYLLYGRNYSHLARAERFAQIWLERAGYDFDVITDLDLHRDPKILRGYKTVLINGHSEYWSLPAYFGLENYLQRDGNVIALSGNSLFWRVSFNEDCSVIECRKVDAPGEQMKPHERGESFHSHDGQRGGLLRECGHPGWKLIGLDTIGWFGEAMFAPYAVEQEKHFLFHHPEKVDVSNGANFGQSPDGGMPRANGHEIDVRPSTLAALQEQATPVGASVPLDPAGMVRLANGQIDWSKGGSAFDYFFRPIQPKVLQGGELIYWERADGGKVFNAGSIASGWALNSDPKFQTLMRNVLFHFGVKTPPKI